MKTIKTILLVLVIIIFIYLLYANFPFYITTDKHNEGQTLLSTQWTGSGPLAAFTPEPAEHTLGCWSTCMAQIMYYHKLQPTGKVAYQCSGGYEIKENLDDYSFDFNHFSNQITAETPKNIANEVARYCYSMAVIVHKDFGTGRYMTKMPSRNYLQRHLPVKSKMYLCYKGWMNSKTKIKNLIIHEIENNRPVFFYYRNMHVKGSGHAVVIDGYQDQKDKFMVHLNFGWAGENDGWYPLFEDIATGGDSELRFWITIKPQI